jgi:molybdenum cofactor synthesis domain-containing protein
VNADGDLLDAARRANQDLVPLAVARSRVLRGRSPLVAVTMPTASALGCVTAESVVASVSVPPFTNSAMDGYALRADDTAGAPCALESIGALMAGSAFEGSVGPGQALRIMTGAPLPVGADAVCMVERTTPDSAGRIVIDAPVRRGENVRRAGGDVMAGDEVLSAGDELTPGALGVLATIGVPLVRVHPRPRVGVLSTGDELVGPGVPLAPGQIHESNRAALLALVTQANCEAVDLGIIEDDEERLSKTITEAARHCDVLISSGGVSVGDKDVVKSVLDSLAGDSMLWMQIAIRPAKPFAFGEVGPTAVPFFGLPGNPVSAMVSFELFARPVLRRLAGHARLERPIVEAIADERLERRRDGKLHLVRVAARFADDGRVHVRSAGGQESHHLHAMAKANGLSLVADGDGIEPGGVVSTMILDEASLAGTALEAALSSGTAR